MKVNRLIGLAFSFVIALNGYVPSFAYEGSYQSLLDAMRGSVYTITTNQRTYSDKLTNYRGHVGGALFVQLRDRNVSLTSDYVNEDPIKQAQFAQALHGFITQNGGGWDNYQAYQAQGTPEQILLSHDEPSERTEIPFESQKNFARKWWANNSTRFNRTSWGQDAYLKDAVLDANNIYLNYEMMTGSPDNYVGHHLWNNATLGELSRG
jgi:hypothetical protein